MLVSKEHIFSVLPQRPPIVMVDELLYSDETSSKCAFTILTDNIFVENGLFGEPGLVENIAQTAAAGVGWHAGRTNQPVSLGYIGAIKDLEIFSLPGVGDRLETEIKLANRVFDVTLVKGTVHCHGKLVASCEMKIFISKQS